MPFINTAKKAKLIQLCRENGLINRPNDSAQLQSSYGTSQIGSEPSTSNITELTKRVMELQKTVQELTGSVTTLHNTNLIRGNSLPSTSAGVSQSLCSSQSQMADLLGRSHNSSHTETTNVLQDTNSQISQSMSSSMEFSRGTAPLSDTSRNSAASAYTQTRFGVAAESLPFVETMYPTLRK